MDPLQPGGNDGLQHQSSEKLSMPRKTVDREDSYFRWNKYSYGMIQLPGFFGDVKHESGKPFPIPNCSMDTLFNIIKT
jgi:hypothetical protein